MKIENSANIIAQKKIELKRKKDISGKSFDSFIENAEEASEASETEGISSLDQAIIISQKQEQEAKRKAKENGKNMISTMERIRLEIANGNLNSDDVRELEKMARNNKEAFFDLKLHDILDEIELRAAVEIAKSEKRGD